MNNVNTVKRGKLLMICFRPPFPAVSGDKIRMLQNIKFLSKKFDVQLLYIYEDKSERINELKTEIFNLVESIYPFHLSKFEKYVRVLNGLLFNKMPLQVNYFYSNKVQKWINENHKYFEFVFCSTIRTAEYVKNKNLFKIIDFVDAISKNYEIAYEKKDFGLWKLLYKIDKKRVLKYEISMLSKFNIKLIISEKDKKFIEKRAKNYFIHVVNNAIDDAILNKTNNLEVSLLNSITFVGKMNYEPNVTAVLFFTNKIFPQIQEKIPNVVLNIVGANPTAKILRLRKNKNISVTGFVNSVEDYILKSKIIVAPMKSGSGIQNKIISAMALGKCVVTTSLGADGLKNLSLNHSELIIADSSDEITLKILELWNDHQRIELIGQNAKNYIEKNFSAYNVEKQFLNIIENHEG